MLAAIGLSSAPLGKLDNDYIAEILYPNAMKKVIVSAGLDPYRAKEIRTSQKVTVTDGIGTLPTNVALECLETAVARLSPAAKTIASIDTGTDLFTVTAHEWWTGMPLTYSTTGITDFNLEPGITYYWIYNASGTGKVATSQANAFAGTAINLTSSLPVGTNTLTPAYVLGTSSYVRDYSDWERSLFSLFMYWTTRLGLIYVRSGATASLTAFTAPVYVESVVFPAVNSGTIEITAGTALAEDIIDSIVLELAKTIAKEAPMEALA